MKLLVALTVGALLGLGCVLFWPAPGTDATQVVLHAGVPAGVTPGPRP